MITRTNVVTSLSIVDFPERDVLSMTSTIVKLLNRNSDRFDPMLFLCNTTMYERAREDDINDPVMGSGRKTADIIYTSKQLLCFNIAAGHYFSANCASARLTHPTARGAGLPRDALSQEEFGPGVLTDVEPHRTRNHARVTPLPDEDLPRSSAVRRRAALQPCLSFR